MELLPVTVIGFGIGGEFLPPVPEVPGRAPAGKISEVLNNIIPFCLSEREPGGMALRAAARMA